MGICRDDEGFDQGPENKTEAENKTEEEQESGGSTKSPAPPGILYAILEAEILKNWGDKWWPMYSII